MLIGALLRDDRRADAWNLHINIKKDGAFGPARDNFASYFELYDQLKNAENKADAAKKYFWMNPNPAEDQKREKERAEDRAEYTRAFLDVLDKGNKEEIEIAWQIYKKEFRNTPLTGVLMREIQNAKTKQGRDFIWRFYMGNTCLKAQSTLTDTEYAGCIYSSMGINSPEKSFQRSYKLGVSYFMDDKYSQALYAQEE